MKGNAGGGGGGALLLLAVQNPGATATIAGLVVVGMIGYGIANAMDMPNREPLADDIIQNSLQLCFNSKAERALYTIDLKDRLENIWSSDLQKYTPASENPALCNDAALNQYVLPYTYKQVGTEYRGEYRVVGLVFKDANGNTQAFVVKPKTDDAPLNTIDTSPDSPLRLNTVLNQLHKMPPETYQALLKDGTSVAAYLQQDGVTQQEGSSTTHDNDGKGWAEQKQMEEILSYYALQSPLRGPITVNGAPVNAPAPQSW